MINKLRALLLYVTKKKHKLHSSPPLKTPHTLRPPRTPHAPRRRQLVHLPIPAQFAQHGHLHRLLCPRCLCSWSGAHLFDAVPRRAEYTVAVCGIGDLIGDDGEEIFALHGAAEAGFGAAVAVVDDAGVDEGAEEGEEQDQRLSEPLQEQVS